MTKPSSAKTITHIGTPIADIAEQLSRIADAVNHDRVIEDLANVLQGVASSIGDAGTAMANAIGDLDNTSHRMFAVFRVDNTLIRVPVHDWLDSLARVACSNGSLQPASSMPDFVSLIDTYDINTGKVRDTLYRGYK